MSFSETIFLFFLALVVFGPKKLPEIARQVGKMLNEFRRASNEFKAQIEQEISHLELEERRRTMLTPTPAPENTASRTLSATGSDSSSAQTTTASAAPTEVATPTESTPKASDPEDEPLFAIQPDAKVPEPPPVHPESSAVTSANSRETHV